MNEWVKNKIWPKGARETGNFLLGAHTGRLYDALVALAQKCGQLCCPGHPHPGLFQGIFGATTEQWLEPGGSSGVPCRLGKRHIVCCFTADICQSGESGKGSSRQKCGNPLAWMLFSGYGGSGHCRVKSSMAVALKTTAEFERRWHHYLKPGLVTLSEWGISPQTWARPRIPWGLLQHVSWGFTYRVAD